MSKSEFEQHLFNSINIIRDSTINNQEESIHSKSHSIREITISNYENENYNCSNIMSHTEIKSRPTDIKGYFNSVVNLLNLGKNAQARTKVEEFISLCKEKAFDKGKEYYNLGEFDNALRKFEYEISKNPKNFSALYFLAKTNMALDNFAEAINQFLKASNLVPFDYRVYKNIGICYFKINKFHEALSNLEDAEKLNPNCSLTKYWKANSYRTLNNLNLALTEINKAIEINPFEVSYYYLKGMIYKEMLKYNEASICFIKVFNLEGAYENVVSMLILCYNKTKEKREEKKFTIVEKLLSIRNIESINLNDFFEIRKMPLKIEFNSVKSSENLMSREQIELFIEKCNVSYNCIPLPDVDFNNKQNLNYISNYVDDYLDNELSKRTSLMNYDKIDDDPRFKKMKEEVDRIKFIERGGEKILLGKGTYGKVYLAKYFYGKVAVKEIKIKDDLCHLKSRIEIELRFLANLSHPNLVRLISWARDHEKFYIVLDYLHISLGKALNQFQKLKINDDQKIIIIYQIASAICYLHSRYPPIIHRDIKSDNVLINMYSLKAYLGDLGVAENINEIIFQKIAGSELWMAPELFDVNKSYKLNLKTDIFSFGVLLKEIIFEKYPHQISNCYKELLENNKNAKMINLIKLSKECCNELPEKRPSIFEVIEFLETKYQPVLYQVDLKS